MHPDKTSDAGLSIIKSFEGLHRLGDDGLVRAYRCPAGKWTVGYGHTKGVRSGMKVTPEECEQFLIDDVKWCEEAVRRHVEVPLSQRQFDALISFVFNLGEGNFARSTLLKRLNKGHYDEVPEQLQRWNKARVDGVLKPLRGLTRRRSAEAALFSMDAPMASEDGDKMPQKPEPTATKPLRKSKTMAGAAAGGVGVTLSATAEQLQGLVPYSDAIKWVFLAVAVAGIALTAYARWEDHKDGVR
jgi:lysozyme